MKRRPSTEINPIWSCHSQLLKKRNVFLIKNKIKIMSFHFLCFLFLFNSMFDTKTRAPSPSTRPVSSGRDTRGPRRHGYPSTCWVKARSHGGAGESSSSSKGTGAGESHSSPKGTSGGAGESQVSREHCKSESRDVKADRSQGSIAMSLKGHWTVGFTRIRMSDCITIIACRQNHFQLNWFFIIWFLNKLRILWRLKTRLKVNKRLL